MTAIRFIRRSWWRIEDGKFFRPALTADGWRLVAPATVPQVVREELELSEQITGLDRQDFVGMPSFGLARSRRSRREVLSSVRIVIR